MLMIEVTLGIISIITALIGVFAKLLDISKTLKQSDVESAKREERQNARLDALEKKVDLHNHYGKKFESCDKNIALIRKDITYMKKDINKLQNKTQSINYK